MTVSKRTVSKRFAVALVLALGLGTGCERSEAAEDAATPVTDAGLDTEDAGGGGDDDAGSLPDEDAGSQDAGAEPDDAGGCPVGMTGDACDECAPGYQDADGDGTCSLGCDATGADALDCGDAGACEVDDATGERRCVCDDGYAGALCDACAAGYELSAGACVLNLPPTENLSLWLDAAHADSLTIVDDHVVTWSDRRAGITTAVNQAVATRRPEYSERTRTGLAVVRFDGVDDELPAANYFGLSVANYEIVVACAPRTDGSPSGILGTTAAGGTTEWGVMLDQAPSNDFRLIHRSPAATTGGHVVTADRSAPLGGTWVAASHVAGELPSMWIFAGDGDAVEETRTNIGPTMGFPSSLTLRVGRTGTGYMSGEIYEVLIYTRRLSDAERQEVIDYLRAKWSLQG